MQACKILLKHSPSTIVLDSSLELIRNSVQITEDAQNWFSRESIMQILESRKFSLIRTGEKYGFPKSEATNN